MLTTTTTTTTTTTASISNPNVDRASIHNLTDVRQIAKYLQYGDDFNSYYAYGPHFLNDEREEKEKRAEEKGQEEDEKIRERNASEQW